MYINDFNVGEEKLLLRNIPKGNINFRNKFLEKIIDDNFFASAQIIEHILTYLCNNNGPIIVDNYNCKPFEIRCLSQDGKETFFYFKRKDKKILNNEIIIEEPMVSRTYEYDYLKGQEYLNLKLCNITFKSKDCSLMRTFYPADVHITYKRGNDKIYLSINKPAKSDYFYLLPNEENFKNRLMEDNLQLTLENVVNIIKETIGSPSLFPKFDLYFNKIINNDYYTHDNIFYENGELKYFLMTISSEEEPNQVYLSLGEDKELHLNKSVYEASLKNEAIEKGNQIIKSMKKS